MNGAIVAIVALNLVLRLVRRAVPAAANAEILGAGNHTYHAAVQLIVFVVPGDMVAYLKLLCHAPSVPNG